MSDIINDILTHGVLTVSYKTASAVVASKDTDAALLLVYLMLHKDKADLSKAAADLGFDENRINHAMQVILGKGSSPEHSVSVPDVNVRNAIQTLPQYSGQEIAQAMADKNYAFLCNEAERCLRRPLRRHECETLLALYEDAGIGADVLAMVLTYITSKSAMSVSDGQQIRISFARVREEAMRWYEKGINTMEKAEAYIKDLEELDGKRMRVRKILGISGRRPSPTELAYIDQFINLDPQLYLIPKAYDITVVNKGSLVWPYMRTILQKWHEHGYKTVADVEEGEHHAKAYIPRQTASAPNMQYEDEVLRFIKNNKEGV